MEFSVLMSLFHKESPKYLDLSLNSIVTNTVQPSQVVFMIDGPIGDELQQVVNKYKELYGFIETYQLPINMGLSNALNIGLRYCKKELVFRMDTDDICYQNRFETAIKKFDQDPELDLMGAYATMIDEEGNESKLMTVPLTNKEIYKQVWTCPFIHPTVVFKKSKLERVGGYNPNSGPRQDDYELWFRCVSAGLKCANINEPLVYYRFFAESILKNNIKVGWWRFKIGIIGSWKCKCPPIAYIGVIYPLVRSLMPLSIRKKVYSIR